MTNTDDIVERYLDAVAAQLSIEERDDIIAELRDLILSRVEAQEETLGRPLNDEEKEAILKAIGHPLVVAARYRKGPDSLIGPELFPYWLFGVKAGLLVLLAVAGVGLVIRIATGSANFGQDIAQAFHGVFGSALTLIGALTLTGAIMEHYAIRPKWLTDWRVKDLSAFGLSDPSQWGAAARTTSQRMQDRRAAWTGRLGHSRTVGDAAFSALATGLFVLWWVGLVRFQGIDAMEIGGETAVVTAAPIWASLFAPILAYALGLLAVDLLILARPQARRLGAAASIVLALAGLWLTWVVFDAGHWFTLTTGADQARIVGGWGLLDVNAFQDLRDSERDVAGVAGATAFILTWIVAISALSLICKIAVNLWRLVQPGAKPATPA